MLHHVAMLSKPFRRGGYNGVHNFMRAAHLRKLSGLPEAPAVKSMESASGSAPDVIVVGAGVIGCSTAYHLSLRGARVLVLDTRGVAAAQSSKSWGFCRQQGRDTRELELMAESMRRWVQLEDELGFSVGWQSCGNLALCDHPKRWEQFQKWMPRAQASGIGTELIDGSDLTKLLPKLEGDWLGGVWTETDGSADPESATRAFARAAEMRGAQFRLFVPSVDALEVQGSRVMGVRLSTGEVINAGCTVVAAGAWSSDLLRPVLRLPQLRVRATAARTERLADLSSDYATFPNIGVWAPRCSFRLRLDGTMTIADGGYAEEAEFEANAIRYGYQYLPGYVHNPVKVNPVHDITHTRDPNPNPRRIDQAAATFHRMFPSLPELRIKEVWAGHIDMTPDMVPVIDVGGDLPEGLVVSTGYSGHGLGIAPGAGRLAADMVQTATRPQEAEVFRAGRFNEKFFFKPESVF